ncbi:unnamed protein product, partial [Nesidiocoris tenuis]
MEPPTDRTGQDDGYFLRDTGLRRRPLQPSQTGVPGPPFDPPEVPQHRYRARTTGSPIQPN